MDNNMDVFREKDFSPDFCNNGDDQRTGRCVCKALR